jgi:O-antigen/teichoic acid export membrane protein
MSWSMLGGGVSAASTLVAAILVARMLGPEKFGALGIIQSTLNTFVIFVGPAVGLTATKFVAEHRETNPEHAGRVLGLTIVVAYSISGILALVLIGGAGYLAGAVYKSDSLAPLLKMAAAALFLSGINGAQSGALAGVEAFNRIASVNFVRGLTLLPLMWFGTKYFGIEGAVFALVLTALIGCVASEWHLQHALRVSKLKVSYRGIWVNSRLLISFSFPAILTSSMVLVAMWLGNVLLVRQPDGFAQFGIFSAANQWRSVILFLPSIVVQPFLPVLSGLIGAGDFMRFRKVLFCSVVLCAASALVPALGAALFSLQIMAAYGAAFKHAQLTLLLVAFATLLAAPTLALNQGLNSLGRAWTSAGIHTIWVTVFIGSVALFGARGAGALALAYTVGYFVQLVVFGWYSHARLSFLNAGGNASAL